VLRSNLLIKHATCMSHSQNRFNCINAQRVMALSSAEFLDSCADFSSSFQQVLLNFTVERVWDIFGAKFQFELVLSVPMSDGKQLIVA